MDDEDRPPWAHFTFNEEARLGTVLDLAAAVTVVAVLVLLVAGAITAALKPSLSGFSGEWRQRIANLTQGITLTSAALVAAAAILGSLSGRVHAGLGRGVAARIQAVIAVVAPTMAVLAGANTFALLSETRFRAPLGYRIFVLGNTLAEIALLALAGFVAVLDRRHLGSAAPGRVPRNPPNHHI